MWIFLVARCGGFLIFSYHNYLTVYLVLVCLSEPFIQLSIKCFRFLKCFCWVWLVYHICLLSLLWFYLFGTQILLHIRIWKEFLCFLWIWFSFKPLLLLERALLLGLYCFVFHQFYRGLLGVVLFFLKRYTKVFCYTVYVTFGNIPPLSLVEKAVFHVFPVLTKGLKFLFVFFIL